jgi:hypothetical protein
MTFAASNCRTAGLIVIKLSYVGSLGTSLSKVMSVDFSETRGGSVEQLKRCKRF